MNTAERAAALARAAESFPLLGKVTPPDLLDVVRLELGHTEILDGFRPYAGHFSRVTPRDPILHVLSGNTPHAGLQSLIRGLLLDAMNFVKLPASGVREVEEFAGMLPPGLNERLRLGTELPEDWLREAKVWIVFGTDKTIAHFRRRVSSEIVFEAHPHRVSLGIVFDDSRGDSSSVAAADIARFNQKGCLSPHDIYVAGDARNYATRLTREMARYELKEPRGTISPAEAAEIIDMRASYRFRAASDPRVGIWESENSTAWTVIYEDDPWFAASCLNRVAFVKPLPANLTDALGAALPWVAAVGIWPATPENAEKAAVLRPSRVCPLGQMQNPPFSWHQEGRQTLAPLARWVDFEPNLG
ncbi:MAG TPA: acyl-CoA reductase [Terrimicrobiaceae bacterium]